MLVVLSGLPGVGKTTIARELASRIGAVHLRIDSIEQAILGVRGAGEGIGEEGYLVAYAVAEDNLRIGRIVIADSVNPVPLTRDSWLEVAAQTGVRALEIEIRCTDVDEHRRRIETRATDVPGLRLPSWQEVLSRDYAPWNRQHLVIDTSNTALDESVKTIRAALHVLSSSPTR
jgi:predicted kinase